MKTGLVFIAALLMVAVSCSPGFCRARACISVSNDDRCLFREDEVDVKIDDGTVIIRNRDTDETIEITERYELFIDGRRIRTDARQRELIGEYHDGMIDLTEDAVRLGAEAVTIGAGGVKLGFKAVAKTVRLLRSDYDRRDLERDMERSARKLEARARRLERKAERLEERAEELKKLHEELRERVPALGEVEWF
jgi:hypothetical protein